MKTVTGKITESTPVTIAKAASILSKFVSTDNGASQALNAYLRRATAAFDELARLHSKSDRRKHKRDSAPDQRVEVSQSALVNDNGQRLKKEVKEEGNAAEEETERRKKKKKRRKGDLEEETERSNEVKKEKIEVEVNEGKVVGKVENKVEEETKKKKKRKSGEIEVEVKEGEKEGKDGLKDEDQRKKKRRRKHEDGLKGEDQRKRKRRRKHEDGN